MTAPASDARSDLSSPDWPARKRDWQRRLPRLRLEAEPIEEQIDRYRRATIALSVVTMMVAGMVLVLFTVFGAPWFGLLVSLVPAGTVISAAWRSHQQLRSGARKYLLDREASQVNANEGPQ
ncbi:hypothetical protein [Tautonia rosea]|uniref:hypothetical protein n=1 Tax=Tautonia rosea TaxID=2728037 RepID=UPI0014748E21|nr:hypothetical protein [Tautonia rosea]